MWQKVSKDEHAHYKDFCNECKAPDRPELVYKKLKAAGLMIPKPKNDSISINHRQNGNKLFAEKKWSKAMNSYNRSLCLAEKSPSENVSLAYANRSACFFELKMYDKCLVDIELAKEAKYPERIMYKLDKRQNKCLHLIAVGGQPEPFQPKLSFEPDDKFPCMANVLEINCNKEFGRLVTSKCDIAVGQTVLMEETYMTAYRIEKYNRCNGCMKKTVNLIPCKNCTGAMFCCSECETNYFHQFECGKQTTPDEDCNDNQFQLMRSVLQAIHIFSTAEELQTFVEEAISSGDPLEIPESIYDEKSRYRAFLKLWFEPNVFKRDTFDQQVYFAYSTLLENAVISSKFNSAKKKRFLMHLIAQHLCIVNYSGNIRFNYGDNEAGYDCQEFRSVITLYVNHSCVPNVTLVNFNGYNILVTIRPIKKGDQLFLSYFRNDLINHSTANRRKYLMHRVLFCCRCQRCEGDSPSQSECNDMISDECYQYIQENQNKVNYGLDGVMEAEVAKTLRDKCVEFLNKHGLNVWSKQVDLVTDCYKRLLSATYNYEIKFF